MSSGPHHDAQGRLLPEQFPRVSVLVPYRPDGGARDQAWTFIRPFWEALGVELVVEEGGPGASPAEFNHPKAINDAARRASNDILLVADADCFWKPELIQRMIYTLDAGRSRWCMPRWYTRLTRTQTRRLVRERWSLDTVLKGRPDWRGDSVSWAGIIGIRRDDFWKTGGYDERFEWWGADDMAFGLTADTLLGPHTRIGSDVIHLWHPAPLSETYGHPKHKQQYDLGERYKEAADAGADREAAIRAVRFS